MTEPLDTAPPPTAQATAAAVEPRGERMRRKAHRARLYAYSFLLVALLVIVIALVVANTHSVRVSWVFGSTRQSLVWIILFTAIVAWLLGLVTGIVFRRRTRAPQQ